MFGSSILDIAIGLVFVFLLLSLICSALNEFIESFLKMRGQYLERGIGELLGDPQNASKLVSAIYNHGMVSSLFKGNYATGNKRDLPSYIPSQNFALALIDVAAHPPTGIALPASLISALDSMKAAAAGKTEVLQANIEAWYNSGMDRVGGWYKRHVQWIILLLGLIVAIAINADTLQLTHSLSTDASLRQALVAAAQAQARTPLPTGPVTDPAPAIKADIESLGTLGLPIGWQNWKNEPSGLGHSGIDWLWSVFIAHISGWLITAIATTLGAPFWFDLLGKFITIRSTIKPKQADQNA
jgi:hypothetical protein